MALLCPIQLRAWKVNGGFGSGAGEGVGMAETAGRRRRVATLIMVWVD